jgi:Gamma-glutamyl cyclotransferase, AIG2-like
MNKIIVAIGDYRGFLVSALFAFIVVSFPIYVIFGTPARLSWIKDHGQEIGSLVTAFGLILGGAWANHMYGRKRRADSAEWLHRLFTGFFVDANGKDSRRLLDFRYAERLRPLLERALIDEQTSFSEEEEQLLIQLDTALNYLEFILHLENTRRLEHGDREAMFGEWYKQMQEPDRAALRYYLRKFGFEALAEEAYGGCVQPERIAFYGTLKDESVRGEQGVAKGDLRLYKPCRISGELVPVDGGTYEGLVTGKKDPFISAELYDVINPEVLKQLDRYEEFYPDRLEDSLYRRTVVRTDAPAVDAWVFIYAGKEHDSGPNG